MKMEKNENGLELQNQKERPKKLSEQVAKPLAAVLTNAFLHFLCIFNIFLGWRELEGFSYQGPA